MLYSQTGFTQNGLAVTIKAENGYIMHPIMVCYCKFGNRESVLAVDMPVQNPNGQIYEPPKSIRTWTDGYRLEIWTTLPSTQTGQKLVVAIYSSGSFLQYLKIFNIVPN